MSAHRLMIPLNGSHGPREGDGERAGVVRWPLVRLDPGFGRSSCSI